MTIQKRFILSVVATMLLAIAIPSTSFAQDRGRGHDGWQNRQPNATRDWQNRTHNNRKYSKKCGKFVNCHDASAGRVDGRGPRGTRVSNVNWRHRSRNRNTNTVWHNRNRRTVRRVYENR